MASRIRAIRSSSERACVWQPGSAGTDLTGFSSVNLDFLEPDLAVP
jgi:hypothetical protein